MLAQTVEVEVEAFVAALEHVRDEEGRRLVIRNGYLPERTIQTGIGPATPHDLADPAGRYGDIARQLVQAEAVRAEKFFQQDFAQVDRLRGFWLAGHGVFPLKDST